ncbi:hypothetical protein [Streptomyces fradiae]|uniref:hypothetical protein n=1 Tax=Streptomyces fradiae TaxID=1906 RepID=UPI0035BE3446
MTLARRLATLLLALVAVVGVSVSAPPPAAADGIIGNTIEGACRVGTGPILGTILGIKGKVNGIGGLTGSEMCDAIGDAGEKVVEAWKNVWDSVLGDIIRAGMDVTKWIIKKVLTFALLAPSVDLAGTGLWGGNATLAGMLTWLGMVIAVAGVMWNLGKMALTGQAKWAGRALAGWVENLVLSFIGVSLFALLLVLGDALSAGLVNATFADDGTAYEKIVAVMLPAAISNPITVLCVVAVLLLIGFIQMVMIFLRQSAIPIICLLLPVAGGGRTGGEATRKWAPTLITTGLVIVAYKPILAIIICVGFSEFGHAKTLAEWLRGCATLVLAILAPGPLTKIFAPFGAAVGAGMGSGGASGALSAAAGYFAGSGKDSDGGGSSSDGGGAPTDAVNHARYVEQQMGSQGQGGVGGSGEDGGAGSDAQAQAARNAAGARVPGQAGADGAPGAAGTDAAVAGTSSATATGTSAGTAAAGTAATAGAGAAVAVGIQVLDGVNDTIQGASGQVGGGNQQ